MPHHLVVIVALSSLASCTARSEPAPVVATAAPPPVSPDAGVVHVDDAASLEVAAAPAVDPRARRVQRDQVCTEPAGAAPADCTGELRDVVEVHEGGWMRSRIVTLRGELVSYLMQWPAANTRCEVDPKGRLACTAALLPGCRADKDAAVLVRDQAALEAVLTCEPGTAPELDLDWTEFSAVVLRAPRPEPGYLERAPTGTAVGNRARFELDFDQVRSCGGGAKRPLEPPRPAVVVAVAVVPRTVTSARLAVRKHPLPKRRERCPRVP